MVLTLELLVVVFLPVAVLSEAAARVVLLLALSAALAVDAAKVVSLVVEAVAGPALAASVEQRTGLSSKQSRVPLEQLTVLPLLHVIVFLPPTLGGSAPTVVLAA